MKGKDKLMDHKGQTKELKTGGITMGRHIVIAISLLERFGDKHLEEFFPEHDAADIRLYLSDLRDKGYIYLPCSCPNPNSDGSCPGFSKERTN